MPAKLDHEAAARVRRMLDEGMEVRTIADMLDMSVESIRRVRRGETWRENRMRVEQFRSPIVASPGDVAQSLANLQKQINPMEDEPTEDARKAAENALDERMKLFRLGDAMLDEFEKEK